jgi:HSP20 family protein
MAVVRWDPTRELESFQTDMNRLFDGIFRSPGGNSLRRWIPATDLREESEDLVLTIDLPGMSEDDVNVEINDNVLTVSGERKDSREDRSENVYRSERTFGQFSRSFTLPEGVDGDRVTGLFDRGVLELRVPKPAARKPKRVEIRSAGESKEETRTIEGSATGS